MRLYCGDVKDEPNLLLEFNLCN